jgi:hypothetical protein
MPSEKATVMLSALMLQCRRQPRAVSLSRSISPRKANLNLICLHLCDLSSPQSAKGRKSKKVAAGQREMLMAIPGKGEGKAKAAAKESKRPARQRKAS